MVTVTFLKRMYDNKILFVDLDGTLIKEDYQISVY